MPRKAAWPKETSAPYPRIRSRESAAIPKIMARARRERMKLSAPSLAANGASARAANRRPGSTIRRGAGGARGGLCASAIVVTPTSSLGGEEAGGAEEQHGRHQDVDQHRRHRPTGLARHRGVEKGAEKARREEAAQRVDEADQDGGEKGAADRADATDH